MDPINKKTPYPLNSPVYPPKPLCEMNVTELLNGYNFFKKHLPTTENYDQHVNLVNHIIEWLDSIERTNDIKNRHKYLDDIKYFFKGQLKKRHRFLDIAQMITDELKDLAMEKMTEFVDEDGNIIENNRIKGFTTDKERKIGF